MNSTHTSWIMALRNQGMRERHWKEISEKIGTNINPETEEFTIKKAFDMELYNYTEAIQKVGDKAGKENQIEVKLDEMEAEWAGIDLDVALYRKLEHVPKGSG